jgi:hypothetical protein
MIGSSIDRLKGSYPTMLKSPRWIIIVFALTLGLVLTPTYTQAQTADGAIWQVEYFPNFYAEGSPQGGGQLGGPLALVWRDGGPAPGIPGDGWTARLTTDTYFPAGRYRFRMLVDDGAALKVSGIELFSTLSFDQHALGCALYADITLNEGIHQVQITYLENNGDASLFFNWQRLTSYNTNAPIYHGCNPPGGATGITAGESAAFNANPNDNASGADFGAIVYGGGNEGAAPATADNGSATEPTVPVAVTDATATTVRINVGTLNVRNAPSASGSTVIGKASFGDVFDVTGAADGWYQIDFDGQVGYVSGRWVRAR